MHIRTLNPNDLDIVLEIEQFAWGDSAASAEMLTARAAAFEAGSIVAVHEGRTVGYAAAQLTDHLSTKPWAVQTGGGTVTSTHRPEGRLAYGVSMSALPGIQGKSVAYHVIEYYADLFLGTGRCDALCVGSRVPGFARWAARPETSGRLADYLNLLANGRPCDPELRLYAANGFELIWGLPNYFPDTKSQNHGAMMLRRRR